MAAFSLLNVFIAAAVLLHNTHAEPCNDWWNYVCGNGDCVNSFTVCDLTIDCDNDGDSYNDCSLFWLRRLPPPGSVGKWNKCRRREFWKANCKKFHVNAKDPGPCAGARNACGVYVSSKTTCHTWTSTKLPKTAITRTTAPVDTCPADIVFVVDESGSIGPTNFNLIKSFLSDVVGQLDIDSGNTRVGVVSYSTDIDTGTSFNLNSYSTTASVQTAISSLSYSGGLTNTASALAYVRTTMLTAAAGDRSNVPNVVVVLTDGQSSNPSATQTEAKNLQNIAGTKVIALGIGRSVSQTELENIGSSPISDNVIRVSKWRILASVKKRLIYSICTEEHGREFTYKVATCPRGYRCVETATKFTCRLHRQTLRPPKD